MYFRISDMEFLRGKFRIWLPCKSSWDAALSLISPIPQSFLSLPRNYLGVQPYFSILPSTCVSTSQKHYWTCADGYTPLRLFNSYKSTLWTCLSHTGSSRQAMLRSRLWSVSSRLTIILRFSSSVDSHSRNYHHFHRIVCMRFDCDGFIYLSIYF